MIIITKNNKQVEVQFCQTCILYTLITWNETRYVSGFKNLEKLKFEQFKDVLQKLVIFKSLNWWS